MAKNDTESSMKYKLDISNLKANIQEANRLVKQANSEFKATTASMDNWSRSADGLSAKQKQLNNVFDAQKQKLEALKEQHRLVAENEGENSKAAQDLTIKINNQEAAIGKTEKQMKELDQTLIDAYKNGKITADEFGNLANEETKMAAKTQLAQKNLNELKSVSHELAGKLKTGLVTTLKASATAIVGMTAASAKFGADFEAGMSEVQAISGATGDELIQLTEKAKEMGAKTKFSASEAAEAFKYMAMAGWKTNDMLEGIEGIMNLAAASGEDLAQVSDIVTDGLTAFGLSAKDSGHFADVLAAASSNANTNVGMMGESFKEVAALSGTMKYSIDDMAVAIGLMANSGIKGSKAGTALKNAIANMAKPTDAMAALMDKYNLSLANADGTMKPFSQVVDELRKAFGGLSKDQQASAAATLFGKEAMAGMLSVINASEADYTKLKTAIANADGSAKEMADTMQDNVKGSLVILGSTLEGLGIQIYDTFKDDLNKAIKSLTTEFNKLGRELKKPDIKNAISSIAKGLIDLIKNGIKLASAVLPSLLKGFSFLASNSKILIPLLGGLAAAMLTYQVKAALAATTTEGLNTVQLIAKGTQLAYKVAMDLLTGALDLQIAKTTILNALHAATPWGALAVGVGALTTALILFNTHEDETLTKLKETADAAKEQKDAWDDMAEAKGKAIQDSSGEFDYYDRLKTELQNLTNENGKVKKGYEGRAQFIINELNSALGTEISMTGNVIDKYKEQMKALDDLIAKQRAKAIIDAGAEAYAEAIKNQTQALKDMTDVENELTKKKQEYAKFEEDMAKNINVANVFYYNKKLDTLNGELKALVSTYNDKKAVVMDYTDTIAQQEYLQKLYAQGNAKDIAAINDYIAKSYDDKGKNVIASIDEQIAIEEWKLSYQKEMYKETSNEIYKDQINASEQRLKKLKEDLKNQTSTIDNGKASYSTAWENMTNEGVKGYKKGTEEYRLAALEQTARAKKGINQGTKETTDAWKYLESQQLASYDNKKKQWKYTEAGERYIEGVKKGIEKKDKRNSIFSSLVNLGNSMIESLKNALDIHSPSREAAKIGALFDAGIVEGLEGEKKSITRSLKSLIDTDLIKSRLGSVDLSVKGRDGQGKSRVSSKGEINRSVVINQTINSPKTLNPLDVHRETKRAIKQMRGYKYV